MSAMRLPLLVCERPRVLVFRRFGRPHEIALLRRLSRDMESLERAGVEVSRSVAGRAFELPVRAHPVIERLQRRIHHAMGFGNELGETLRVRRYVVGERHPPHVDSYSVGASTLIATAMLCLNTPTDGGETVFSEALPAALSIAPVCGNLLAWFSSSPTDASDPRSLHEGAAVRAGVKLTATEFLYQPLARARRTPRHQEPPSIAYEPHRARGRDR